MIHVIFICTGNICRSPLAEGLLRYRWEQMGRDNLKVTSMGIHGLDNQPAAELSQKICKESGFDISSHRSRPVTYDELRDADIVFTMERAQKDYLKLFFPGLGDKVFLFGSWPGKETRRGNVRDPIGGNAKLYAQVFNTISDHMDRVIPYLLESFA